MYTKGEKFRKKIYKVLDNCVTRALKGGIWLDIFTRSQSYLRDIFYKLDNNIGYMVSFRFFILIKLSISSIVSTPEFYLYLYISVKK